MALLSFALATAAAVTPAPTPPPYHPPHPTPAGAKDIIMIPIDDMRPELGSYGCAHMDTPNMDALATESLIFDNAYVAVAWCSPSRTALLTGRRPDATRTWSVVPTEFWRERGGNFTTLTQHFKERGYLTLAVGKIFHPGAASGNSDSNYSWSWEGLPYDGRGIKCPTAKNLLRGLGGVATADAVRVETVTSSLKGGAAMSPSPTNQDDSLSPCANRTFAAIAARRRAGIDARPFFFSVGFHKPHIPWTVPQKYYDKYPLEGISLAPHRLPPTKVPSIALNDILSGYWSDTFSDFQALRANGSITNSSPADGTMLNEYWSRRARQAYWAALSYTDDNVGELIASAKAAGLYANAIIVLWGDHGYQLGANDQWSKVSNFEQAVRIPLMIRVPGSPSMGKRTSALWEAVDLWPTLSDLAMGEAEVPPRCPDTLNASRAVMECVDGISAKPLFSNPSPTASAAWKTCAISQVPRGKLVNGEPGNVAGEEFMGYTVRVGTWRYTEWVGFDNTTGIADWSNIVGKELYPETLGVTTCAFDTDFANVVADPQHSAVVAQLSKLLRTIV